MLRRHYGLPGQMTLSYDMTFLVMLLTSLYEPVDNREKTDYTNQIPIIYLEEDTI